jgi:gluconate kinase
MDVVSSDKSMRDSKGGEAMNEDEIIKWMQRIHQQIEAINSRQSRLEYLLARLLTEKEHSMAEDMLKRLLGDDK